MKLFTVLLALTFIVLFQNDAFSQEIPNAGFENWTDGDPDGWITFDFSSFNMCNTICRWSFGFFCKTGNN